MVHSWRRQSKGRGLNCTTARKWLSLAGTLAMDQDDLDLVHCRLCNLYKAIGRLQRYADLVERRGIDCAPVHELIAVLREHVAAVRSYGKLPDRQARRRISMLTVGLLSWQLPFGPWAGAAL